VPEPVRRTRRPLTVAALVLALFLAALEMTVVSTAMPTVVADLGGALHYGWVFSAYMLATTATVPIYGKLADIYGRKPVLFVAMAIFLAASMASGQARSMTALIAFRAIQGVGAGGIQPIVLTIVGDIFDVEERAKMQGIFGAVWGIAGLAGPLLGGVIVATLSWRWVFYVNVPFGLLSSIILATSLVETVEKKEPQLDIAGAILLAVSVIALLLGVGGFAPLLLVPASIAFAVAFVLVELKAPEPMLPPRLFVRRLLATSSVLSALTGAAMIGIVTFLPLYAQGVLGASPTAAGASIAPMAIGWPIASAISGRLLRRVGVRTLVRFGIFVVTASSVALAFIVSHRATSFDLRAASALFGVGMGFANTAQIIAIQSSVAYRERGVVTASLMFFRSIGGTVGVGVMGAVLARTLMGNPLVRGEGGGDLVARMLGPERRSLPADLLAAVADDLALAIVRVTLCCVVLALASALGAWLFPRVELTARAPAS
jgi:EmrB/QacA subfamily drug resistance transporter